MRIVTISDTHGDKGTLGLPRADEVEAAIDDSVAYAIEHKVDAWVHGGDLCDPDAGGATLRSQRHATRTACVLARAGIRQVWLVGNHDGEEGGYGETSMSPIKGIEESGAFGDLVVVADKPRLVRLSVGYAIACLPHASIARLYDPAQAAAAMMTEAGDDAVIVFSHLTVPGIAPGEETIEMPRGRDLLFPGKETASAIARIQGHYHRRQVFDLGDGGPPLHVIGAAARLTFADGDHEPGFLVLDV